MVLLSPVLVTLSQSIGDGYGLGTRLKLPLVLEIGMDTLPFTGAPVYVTVTGLLLKS
jgi:hypothetical protein